MSTPPNPLASTDVPSRAPSMWSNLAEYLPVVAAHVAAAAGNYRPLDMLNQQRDQLAHWQQLRDQHELLNSQLQSADLQRQRTQQELDNFQTPSQAQAMQLDTAGKVAALQNEFQKPDQFIGTDDQQRPAYFQRKFNAGTREWDTSPVTTEREMTISSPDSPRIPFDPSQVVTRSTRSQLLAPQPKQPNVSTREDLQHSYVIAAQRGDMAQATKLQGLLKAIDPIAGEKIGVTIRGQDLTQDRATTAADRQAIRQHDKDYVLPAENTEKSYQMMQHAYDEYQQAQSQGKELPTGAQSMVALSTHLSSTFGNVKGARITKDMIQEHLGARGISDTALVAVQRLTNGDALSPDQWNAFHDLIGQSRQLSWQTAVKEAKRKDLPIDFLPPDLQGLSGSGSNGAPPPGAKVIQLSDFLNQK